MSWARLLKRVFDIDVECCACGGKLKIIAAIEELAVIVRILTHLGLPARAPPCSPARCRVRKVGERAQFSPNSVPLTVPSAGDTAAGSKKGVLKRLSSAKASNRPLEAVWEERKKANPAGRFGDPAEFGHACALLWSAGAGFTTGQNLLLDGGAYPGTF
jgi:hypothetical protein